ncbi:MAG: hypothetical protein ABIG93_05625 [archaeon]|nr:hypothetical protein [Nanoarchaeota archaeon]
MVDKSDQNGINDVKQKFILSKCKTKAAYSAKLKKPGKLNLNKIKKKFEVVMDTEIVLVLKVDGVELICHAYGELLFKNCDDLTLMEKIAEKVYSMGLE